MFQDLDENLQLDTLRTRSTTLTIAHLNTMRNANRLMPGSDLAVGRVTDQRPAYGGFFTRAEIRQMIDALTPILKKAIPHQKDNLETTERNIHDDHLEDCWATRILEAWGEKVEPCGNVMDAVVQGTGCSLM